MPGQDPRLKGLPGQAGKVRVQPLGSEESPRPSLLPGNRGGGEQRAHLLTRTPGVRPFSRPAPPHPPASAGQGGYSIVKASGFLSDGRIVDFFLKCENSRCLNIGTNSNFFLKNWGSGEDKKDKIHRLQ